MEITNNVHHVFFCTSFAHGINVWYLYLHLPIKRRLNKTTIHKMLVILYYSVFNIYEYLLVIYYTTGKKKHIFTINIYQSHWFFMAFFRWISNRIQLSASVVKFRWENSSPRGCSPSQVHRHALVLGICWLTKGNQWWLITPNKKEHLFLVVVLMGVVRGGHE